MKNPFSKKTNSSNVNENNRKNKRVSVFKEVKVIIYLNDGRSFNVLNLSFNGLAFMTSNTETFNVKDEFKGNLNVNGHHFHLDLCVRHIDKKQNYIGCHVINSENSYMNTFLNEYKNELENQSNKKNSFPYWFISNQFEIYYTQIDDELNKIQIIKGHKVLEFNQEKIYFGFADQKMDRNNVYFKGLEIINLKNQIPKDFILEAIDYVSSIPEINKSHQDQILKKLKLIFGKLKQEA